MRISDWSSDVCSSDLNRACARAWQAPSGRSRLPAWCMRKRRGAARNWHGAWQDFRVSEPAWRPIPRPNVIPAKAGTMNIYVQEESAAAQLRSEERSVVKECVSTCRSRKWQINKKKNTDI